MPHCKRVQQHAHLLLQHVLSSAYQQASRQLPEDHQDFLVSRLQKLKPSDAPNTFFILESFAALGGHDAFRAGLDIVADAIDVERRSLRASASGVKLRTFNKPKVR
jgi:hypothetical protein